jgi:hypothetical protein
VIDVPADATLGELHGLLQAGLGWTDSHLHQFTADGVRYGAPDPDWNDLEVQDEAKARLGDLPARFEYLYDFGDGWEHDVEVLGRGEEAPGCVEATGDCPPEDCGGPPGYQHLREALADPQTDCGSGRVRCRHSTGRPRTCWFDRPSVRCRRASGCSSTFSREG